MPIRQTTTSGKPLVFPSKTEINTNGAMVYLAVYSVSVPNVTRIVAMYDSVKPAQRPAKGGRKYLGSAGSHDIYSTFNGLSIGCQKVTHADIAAFKKATGIGAKAKVVKAKPAVAVVPVQQTSNFSINRELGNANIVKVNGVNWVQFTNTRSRDVKASTILRALEAWAKTTVPNTKFEYVVKRNIGTYYRDRLSRANDAHAIGIDCNGDFRIGCNMIPKANATAILQYLRIVEGTAKPVVAKIRPAKFPVNNGLGMATISNGWVEFSNSSSRDVKVEDIRKALDEWSKQKHSGSLKTVVNTYRRTNKISRDSYFYTSRTYQGNFGIGCQEISRANATAILAHLNTLK